MNDLEIENAFLTIQSIEPSKPLNAVGLYLKNIKCTFNKDGPTNSLSSANWGFRKGHRKSHTREHSEFCAKLASVRNALLRMLSFRADFATTTAKKFTTTVVKFKYM